MLWDCIRPMAEGVSEVGKGGAPEGGRRANGRRKAKSDSASHSRAGLSAY